jgi:hypothetical protein
MASVQSTESKDNLPRSEFISPSLIVLEKQIKNREDGAIQKVRILPVSQQAGNILPSEFRTDDRSKILERIRGSSKFSQILNQIQGMDQKQLEKFLDEKFLGGNISYNEDRWEGLLIFFRKPDGAIDYEKLAAWIVYSLDHLKGVSIFRDSLFFDQKSLEPGVWGQLFKFIPSNSKSTTISLQGNLSLTIERDKNGDFFVSSKVIGLSQKTYITTEGIVLYRKGGQLHGILVSSPEALAEIYKSLREDGVDRIYYLYSGDHVKGNDREKGIRLEILSDRPQEAVYHGNRIIQSFHALKDGRPVIVQIATMKDTEGVIYQHYRIIEANGSYNIFQGWQRLSEESFDKEGHLATVRLQDGTELKDRIIRHRIAGDEYLYFAPVYYFEKRDGKGNLISTYTLSYQTSGADHILDYSRSQQELVFKAHNRYVEGSDVKLLYSLNMSAKVVIVDREGRMYDINGSLRGTYSDSLTYQDLDELGIQDVRGGFYRPPRDGDRIIAISKDGQKKEIKLYPETVGFKLQTYNPNPITRDINGTILSDEYVAIAELKPYENSKLVGPLRISVFIPNYASGSESKQSLILKEGEHFIYKDGKIYLTKRGLEEISSKIGSDDVVLSVKVESEVRHQNDEEVLGSVPITQTQNLTLNFKTLEASIQQQGQEVVGIKIEGNQSSFTTNPTVLTISAGPNTVIESYKDIQLGYYENGKWVSLERGYEVRQKDGNIEIVLTDPSLIALYQRLGIIGEVIYRNKDGKDRKTERIDHTFSVGVLGFELQTYNPKPIIRDINGTILSDEDVSIAELKPYRNSELRPSRIFVYASASSESKEILSLEQNKDFIYKDGKMSLTKEGLEKLSKIGSDTVFLSVKVESAVRDRQNERVLESLITEEGRLTLNFKTLEASIQQQGQEVVGIKIEGNQYSFTTNPTVLTISAGPNTVIESYKDIQLGYYENGKWVSLERGYEVRQKDGNIEIVLTDPSLIALYQRLGIIGEVIYRNKDGKDRKTERIDHTFSVGVLGFELQTYNPKPIIRDINGTILSDEDVSIAELKPYRNSELRPSRIFVYASASSESKEILSLEQNKDFIYKDGKMSLTKEGLEKLSKIGSDTVFLSVKVESAVRDRQNERVLESLITEEGRLTLNFKTLEASIQQQGQEVVGIKIEGNQYSFTTNPTVLTISAGPNTVIESYKDIQLGYYENGKWVSLERGYEVRQKDGNIEIILTDPSLIALYQRLGIIGEVIYRNKDGKDRKTERIDHTFSVGVLGFELQTYNPKPIIRDINGTILSDEDVSIAELKPYRNSELRPSRIFVYASASSESKEILSLEQNKDFIYKDGKMSLTKEGLEKLSKIGSDTVFLSVKVESAVRDRQNERVLESLITEEGRLTLNFKTLEASIQQQGQEVVGIKREGNQYSFTTNPTVLTISAGPNTVIESYKDIQLGYYENGKWVSLERGYEVRQKDGNIEIILTDPSLIALYQRLGIIGEVIYRNKDGKDRKTERIDHTFSVGVLGFELQTYNPKPIIRDINGTILSDEDVSIAELKPYRNSELRPSRIFVYASASSESKEILSLEQNKDFIYKDGKMSLTKEGLEKLSKIGSDTVFLSVKVESAVRDRQNERVLESLITEEGRLTLNFKTLEASIQQQGQEVVGIKREGNQYSFTTNPTVLTISAGPNTVIESYKDIQLGYYENGKWVSLERGYEVRQKDGNIEIILTDPSLIALYQRLGIIGEVIYRNKDGKDRKTERIDHTFSVGVLGFELQTYNPKPIIRDINGTILSDEDVSIAELKPYRNSELRPSRIFVYASASSESKEILSLEQNKDFIYKDGKMSLTKEGLEKLSKIGSDTVFLSVKVESAVRDRQNERVLESLITEEGRLTLNFKTLEASIQQQGQEVVGIKREGNQYSFTTNPTVLTISAGPNTVIESYKDIQLGYYENGKWVSLERGYEVRQKDGNIEIILTDPSLIALYQRLGIIGEVIYRNKDGKDRKTERIDHTFSVGVLGFELQTYNPKPIIRDINGTILSDEDVSIAELKPYRNSELRPSRIFVYASASSESKEILSLEQNKDFIYKDGKMSLTKEGLEKLSKIGSDTVFLSVKVESAVRDRQNERVLESLITEEGRLTLNFKTLEASIQQQGQEVVGIKREGNQYSFTTNPTVLTISAGPNTVIESYKDIQLGYYENGKWVSLERGYEVRQKDGNIEIILTDPSLIALYQRLGIIGEVIYRNKDGKDRKTERIDHTFSVRLEEVKYALELKAPKYILEGAREPEVPFTVKTNAPSYEV